MADELNEIHEQAEHARENRELLPITFTLAVLAVFVALVTLLGHRAHTHELLMQNKASDTWAEYQAQSIRQHTYESFAQVMSVLDFKDAPKAETIRAAFESQSPPTPRAREPWASRRANSKRKCKRRNAGPTATISVKRCWKWRWSSRPSP